MHVRSKSLILCIFLNSWIFLSAKITCIFLDMMISVSYMYIDNNGNYYHMFYAEWKWSQIKKIIEKILGRRYLEKDRTCNGYDVQCIGVFI